MPTSPGWWPPGGASCSPFGPCLNEGTDFFDMFGALKHGQLSAMEVFNDAPRERPLVALHHVAGNGYPSEPSSCFKPVPAGDEYYFFVLLPDGDGRF